MHAGADRRDRPVKVVVVEDSLVQRAHLVKVLEAGGEITVVGQAIGAAEAVEVVARQRPDVVTLDLEIPEGGGQFAIEQIMGDCPTPILVLSAEIVTRASSRAVEALVGGAVDALPKPSRWTSDDEEQLRAKVKSLRAVPVLRHPRGRLNRTAPTSAPEPKGPTRIVGGGAGTVVAIAASTGGPPALAEVLGGLAGLRSPVILVQHLHEDFVTGLVEWMARTSGLPVKLAVDGEPILPGTVYIGPGGQHVRVAAGRRIQLRSEPESIHRPSADELFRSMAEHVGSAGVGVILTGMGSDGADGLLDMHRRGATTIGQDEASCAVYGMPRAAARLGALTTVVPLREIAGEIVRACSVVKA